MQRKRMSNKSARLFLSETASNEAVSTPDDTRTREPETEPLLTSYGRVYIVTSHLLPFLKLGRWGSSKASLISRYKTVYGADIELYTWLVVDDRETETRMKEAFVEYRLSGELYHKNDKKDLDSYRSDSSRLLCKIR